MSEMSQINNPNNGVNGSGTLVEAEAPGRGPVATQSCPDRHQATADRRRVHWTKELNKLVMKCCLKSDPSKRGYRKRMLAIWNEIGVFETTEQQLAGQVLCIKNKGWLSQVEIEEIK